MIGLGVILAFSLQVVRESTLVREDTQQVVTVDLSGSRNGLPYSAILGHMTNETWLIRTPSDTLAYPLPYPLFQAFDPDGHVLYLQTTVPETLVFTGMDSGGNVWRDTISLPSGWSVNGGDAVSCAAPASSAHLFCFLLHLYDGTDHYLRLFVWEISGAGLSLHQTVDLDTFVNGPSLLRLVALPSDVPVSTWTQYPTLLVQHDNPDVDSCYIRMIHPFSGEVASWAHACASGFTYFNFILPHIRSADTLLVDLVQSVTSDTSIRILLNVSQNGVNEVRKDTLLLQFSNKAISSLYDPVEGDYLCVIGVDPSTGDRMAYALPLGSGAVLQANVSSTLSPYYESRVIPTGEDDNGCIVIDHDPGSPKFVGFRVSGGTLVATPGRTADPNATYRVENKAVGGLPTSGTVWWGKVDISTQEVMIGAANILDLLTGSSANLVDDSFWITGPRSGWVTMLNVLEDTLALGVSWMMGAPPEVAIWDTSFAGLWDHPFQGNDTALFGAPWVLIDNPTQTILSLDRATGSLRPGSYTLSGASGVYWPSDRDVQRDTVFFCYRNTSNHVVGLLLDVASFSKLDSFEVNDPNLSFAQCRWDGNLLVMAATRTSGDSTHIVVYDRSASLVTIDTLLEGTLERLHLWGNLAGMVLANSSSRDYIQCTVGASLVCNTWSQPLAFVYHAVHYDGARTYIVGNDGTTLGLYVLDPSLSLVEFRDLGSGIYSGVDIASVDTLYGVIMTTPGGSVVRWYALGESSPLDDLFLSSTNINKAVFVHNGGEIRWYVSGAVTSSGTQIPYVAVVQVDTTTPVTERSPLPRGVRVVMRGPWLMLEGQGMVDLSVLNMLGRRVMEFRGDVRGQVRVGRLPVRGVYVVKESRTGLVGKVVWIGR